MVTANVFAFDTETMKILPGLRAPPMACLTWQTPTDAAPQIIHGRDARPVFERALRDPNTLIVGHFVAFDLTVCAAAWPDLVPEIFAAYESNRVTCTMLREKLFDIATGRFRGFADERGVWRKHDYGLDSVAQRRAGTPLKKDGWRMRYGEVLDLPLDQWVAYATEQKKIALEAVEAGVKDKDLEAVAYGAPEEILRYPLEDARATLATYVSQEATRARCAIDPFADEHRQAMSSVWKNLMTTWGVLTNPIGVERLRVQTFELIERLTDGLVGAGLVRKDGSRDTKAATARMLDVMGWRSIVNGKDVTYEKVRPDARVLRKTKGGGITLDRDACKESDDPILIDYGDRAQLKAVADKDVPMLAAGTHYPVHPRIDIAASGRTTMSAPNLQNLRRLPGIREACIPRAGNVYIQADYPGLELRTLAQVCFDLFGASTLGDMLNRGEDPHLAFAATLLGISYAEAKRFKKRKDVDDARQIGKVFNFGSPGGLGAEKLVLFARKTYGVNITVEDAREWKKVWLETLPEMREFFAYVGSLTDNAAGLATIVQLRSHRIRGGAPFCATCNTWFQGLGADAANDAGFHIAKACYAQPESPLYGSRIVNYVHDEFIGETKDDERAHDAAHELARVMMVRANVWLPNVPFLEGQIEPLLMRLWSKDAEPLHDPAGRLIPWTQELGAVLAFSRGVTAFANDNPTLRVAA